MENKKDLYKLLEVPKTATAQEIKKAYRKLALQWHPDKNPGKKEESENRFKEITAAFEILSNPEKREQYDKFGIIGKNSGVHDFKAARDLFEDIFKDLFDDDDPFDRSLKQMFAGTFQSMFPEPKTYYHRTGTKYKETPKETYTVTEPSPFIRFLMYWKLIYGPSKTETWTSGDPRNGKYKLRKRVKLNGDIIETVEEDGRIISKKVNDRNQGDLQLPSTTVEFNIWKWVKLAGVTALVTLTLFIGYRTLPKGAQWTMSLTSRI